MLRIVFIDFSTIWQHVFQWFTNFIVRMFWIINTDLLAVRKSMFLR